MRSCQPAFLVDTALVLDPTEIFVGKDIFEDPVFSTHLPLLINSHLFDSSDLTYRSRFLLHSTFDSFGLSGLLVPQTKVRVVKEQGQMDSCKMIPGLGRSADV
ncbi:hypothetical protein POTOM_040642 [Populus tomentosa]|uniref:Uncharacterized protein n=1 Tax=Populus tomentosa TaxID=118781 RepID=A0A8X7YPE4_POPTO|nr:hypothetical protein POTOM_040642 [Populus tomentosa]